MVANRTDVRTYGHVERIAAGIDWLSISLDRHYRDAAWWASKCFETMKEVVNDGNRLKAYTLNGYYGQGAAGCFAGERPESYYAQFAGSYADDAFWSVFREDAHVSRIDLRVDVKFAAYRADIARKGYRSAVRANNQLPSARQRKIYILEGNDGGATLYVGAPTSEQRGRLYNKDRQSENPSFVRTWRYEVVFRNDYAQSAASTVYRAGAGDFETIRAIVATWYAARGIPTRHYAVSNGPTAPIVRTIPSDVDTRLNWLKSQVAPALRWLAEVGATNEMWEALGLSKPEQD